jgi:hypothetical protein
LSHAFLPERAENARQVLEVAEQEASHLAYSYRTLYAHAIDLPRVDVLNKRGDLSEKIGAFVGRFGRLQDYMGENAKTMLDALAFAKKWNV